MEGNSLYARGDFQVGGDFLSSSRYLVGTGQLLSEVVNAV